MSCYPSVLAPALRPLEALLDDPAVTAIHINGPDQVWVCRRGALQRSDVELSGAKVRAIAGALGRAMGHAEEAANFGCRFAEGLGVQVVAASVAVEGPVISLTKAPPGPWTAEDLLSDGYISAELLALLSEAVTDRRGVLIVGADSQTRRSFLVAVASLLAPSERVVMIETGDIHPPDHPQLVRLRVGDAEGEDRLALIRAAIKLAPGRLILDDLSGGEAADLLLHGMGCFAGSLVSMGAPSAELGLFRLAALAATGGGLAGDPAALVAGAFGLVVHCASAGVGVPVALEAARIEPSGPGGGPVLQVVYRGGEFAGAGVEQVPARSGASAGVALPSAVSSEAEEATAPRSAARQEDGSALAKPSPPTPPVAPPEATIAAGIAAVEEESDETMDDVSAQVMLAEATGMGVPRWGGAAAASSSESEAETTARVRPAPEAPIFSPSPAFEEATNIVRFSAEQLDELEQTDD